MKSAWLSVSFVLAAVCWLHPTAQAGEQQIVAIFAPDASIDFDAPQDESEYKKLFLTMQGLGIPEEVTKKLGRIKVHILTEMAFRSRSKVAREFAFMTMCALWLSDDIIDTKKPGKEDKVENLILVVEGKATPVTPIENLWGHLIGLIPEQNLKFRALFRTEVVGYLNAALDFDLAAPKDVTTYVAKRTFDAGVRPSIVAGLFDSQHLDIVGDDIGILNLSSKHVAVVNDVFSYQLDARKGKRNLLDVIIEEQPELDLDGAVSLVGEIASQAWRELVLVDGDNDLSVLCRDWPIANIVWSSRSDRYRSKDSPVSFIRDISVHVNPFEDLLE